MPTHLIRKVGIFLCGLSISFAAEKSYVTCDFQGQLGNQMFQVAATVAYGLDHHYEAVFPSIDRADYGSLNHQYIFHRLNTSLFPGISAAYHHQEIHYATYQPIPCEEGKNTRLTGFFQSEKYFSHHANVIRTLFAPTKEILGRIQRKYGSLLTEKTVAVHFRTYIPDGRNQNLGKDSVWWNYFIDAIRYFPEDFLFLIFSDSPETVRRHFPACPRRVEFIEGNPHHIDFYLMSLCQHQVVSPGSSFSWWAAWLNNNPHKIIIAPHTWSNKEDEDAIPPSWIRIKAWPNSD